MTFRFFTMFFCFFWKTTTWIIIKRLIFTSTHFETGCEFTFEKCIKDAGSRSRKKGWPVISTGYILHDISSCKKTKKKTIRCNSTFTTFQQNCSDSKLLLGGEKKKKSGPPFVMSPRVFPFHWWDPPVLQHFCREQLKKKTQKNCLLEISVVFPFFCCCWCPGLKIWTFETGLNAGPFKETQAEADETFRSVHLSDRSPSPPTLSPPSRLAAGGLSCCTRGRCLEVGVDVRVTPRREPHHAARRTLRGLITSLQLGPTDIPSLPSGQWTRFFMSAGTHLQLISSCLTFTSLASSKRTHTPRQGCHILGP